MNLISYFWQAIRFKKYEGLPNGHAVDCERDLVYTNTMNGCVLKKLSDITIR